MDLKFSKYTCSSASDTCLSGFISAANILSEKNASTFAIWYSLSNSSYNSVKKTWSLYSTSSSAPVSTASSAARVNSSCKSGRSNEAPFFLTTGRFKSLLSCWAVCKSFCCALFAVWTSFCTFVNEVGTNASAFVASIFCITSVRHSANFSAAAAACSTSLAMRSLYTVLTRGSTK